MRPRVSFILIWQPPEAVVANRGRVLHAESHMYISTLQSARNAANALIYINVIPTDQDEACLGQRLLHVLVLAAVVALRIMSIACSSKWSLADQCKLARARSEMKSMVCSFFCVRRRMLSHLDLVIACPNSCTNPLAWRDSA